MQKNSLDNQGNCNGQCDCLEDRIQFPRRRIGPRFPIESILPREEVMRNLNGDDTYEEHFVCEYIDEWI